MPNEKNSAFVLADYKAPYTNSAKYGKIGTVRKEMLSEAFSIISNMSDKQFDIFLQMLGRELQ